MTLLYSLFVFVSVLLIIAILLQPGSKGGGLGAAFGGGGANSAFGAQGATPFLAKATYWLAGLFLAACIIIEILIVKQGQSVVEKTSVAPSAPVQPLQPAQK